MKAADIEQGAHLYWQRSKYGRGHEVVVIDPRPIFGKTSPYSQDVCQGFGTGVLCEEVGVNNPRRVAAPLRQLLGPYRETKRRIAAEERAADKARNEQRQERRRIDARLKALATKTKRVLGVHVYTKNDHPWSPKVEVNADVFAQMVEELGTQGWKPTKVDDDD